MRSIIYWYVGKTLINQPMFDGFSPTHQNGDFGDGWLLFSPHSSKVGFTQPLYNQRSNEPFRTSRCLRRSSSCEPSRRISRRTSPAFFRGVDPFRGKLQEKIHLTWGESIYFNCIYIHPYAKSYPFYPHEVTIYKK